MMQAYFYSLQAFNTTDLGGQYVTDPSQTLGGPWICPTPPQYSDGECDPCGKNTSIPNPYWGAWLTLNPFVAILRPYEIRS